MIVSAKQYGLMQAKAHGGSKMRGGPSREVAREFIEETPPRKRQQYARQVAARRHGPLSDLRPAKR